MKIKILNLSSYNLQVARKRYSLLDKHEQHVDFIQDQKWTNYEPSVSFFDILDIRHLWYFKFENEFWASLVIITQYWVKCFIEKCLMYILRVAPVN